MIKDPINRKVFRANEFSATINAGEDERYGAGSIAFGKIVCPSLQQLLDSDSLELSVDFILAYRGLNFTRRTDYERSLLFRPVIKGVGPLDEEEKMNLSPTIRSAVDTTLNITLGPASNFFLTKAEEVIGHAQGVLFRSSGESRIISPATGESLGEIAVQQTVYETFGKLPEDLRNTFSLEEGGSGRGIICVKARMKFIEGEVEKLLNYMKEEKISPGEKYEAPCFVLRFEHNPFFDEVSIPRNLQRNATMFVHVEGKNPGYLESPIYRGLFGNELYERLVRFRNSTEELRRETRSITGEIAEIDREIEQLKAVEKDLLPADVVGKFNANIPLSAVITLCKHAHSLLIRSSNSNQRQLQLFENEIDELKRLAGEGERVNF